MRRSNPYDHLGSVAAVTNASGQVIERMAYDPWGKRRNVNGLGDPLDQLWAQTTDRGYTQHEHLDEVGVIHMNGRIYDPLMGRFMSADPFIQAIDNLQSHNRYAYVMNNPLGYTDPSGYFLKKLFKKVAVRAIAAVADFFGCAGACTMAVNAYYGYKSGGPAGLAASLIPGSSNAIANAAIEAGKGCLVAAANGGNCGRGAGSALIVDQGANFGLPGHLIAGCLAAANQGGSCRRGAVSAYEGLAANHISKGLTEGLTGSARRQQDISRALGGGETYENTLVPVAVAAVAPETAALMGVWAFRVFRLAGVAQRMRALSDILTANEAADGAGSNVRDNNRRGQEAEDEVAADLEGAGFDIDRQVQKGTPFGPRVIDIEVKDKDGNVLGGVEVKSGGSRYRADQRSKDEWLRRNGYPVNVIRKP